MCVNLHLYPYDIVTLQFQYQNLYNVGTQNGNSGYAFTSMETAVDNAIHLLHQIEPRSKKIVKKKGFLTLNQLLISIFAII